MNVLEHIFNAQQLLRESARILTSGGKIVIAVPYLFPYHPSPNDYFRFSKTALERMLSEAGFVDIAIRPLGSGMFSARLLMFERLLPGSVQKLLALLTHPFVRLLDSLFTSFARSLRKKYDPSDYALGFLVTARHE
jgi:SAM-dependent methyltransferase